MISVGIIAIDQWRYDWVIIVGLIFSIRENREEDDNDKSLQCEEKREIVRV